jgi:hypothetical protein
MVSVEAHRVDFVGCGRCLWIVLVDSDCGWSLWQIDLVAAYRVDFIGCGLHRLWMVFVAKG